MIASGPELLRPRRARPDAPVRALVLISLATFWLVAARRNQDQAVVRLWVAPASASLGTGSTQQYQVTAVMSDDQTTTPTVTWTAVGGTITSSGLYTAGSSAGTFRVIAVLSGGTISDTATVTVTTSSQDRIALQQDDAAPPGVTDETIVYVDAEFKSNGTDWRNDERAPGSLLFGNLWMTSGGKADEIVVFSVNDPLTIDQGPSRSGKIWSDAAGEIRKVALSGPVPVVPLTIYLLVTPGEVACSGGSSISAMGCDILNLEVAYNLQRVGLKFDVVMKDLRGDPNAGTAVGCGLPGATYCWCRAAPPTSGGNYYDPSRLNVYVVGGLSGNGMGQFCAAVGEDRNSIYLDGRIRGPFLLAHEIGHALNLWHTWTYAAVPSGWPSGAGNLMDMGGGEVPTLTMGQAFRANVLPASWANLHTIRAGPTRACEPNYADDPTAHIAGAVMDGDCPRISHPW